VEVDRPVADAAAAEVGDEGLAELVQQRTAEEDRDAAGAGVRVDVRHVRGHDVRGVEQEVSGLGALGDLHPVHLEEAADHADIADARHAAQQAGGLAQQRRHHRLRHEILGPADLDPPLQRDAAVDGDAVEGEADALPGLLGVGDETVHGILTCPDSAGP
jgi:hypothetical protein